ncbi:MAG TPA: amidohydrolase family protein [Acidimicrobiales bacterium]|nr:amidohydrolase family protein [Acidimicrobiales bacterium]
MTSTTGTVNGDGAGPDDQVGEATDRYVVVSSDTHAGADLYGYKPYLESRWHDEFDVWAGSYRDAWAEVDAGEEVHKIGVASGRQTANWDSARRVRELEGEGVVGEIVIPNTSPPFFPSGVLMAGSPRDRTDYEHRWAGLRAHNRWLLDFCGDLPGRRAGVIQVFLNDVDDAVAEVEWAASAGHTGGILLPIIFAGEQLPPLYSPAYDRLFAACEAVGFPVTQHAASVGGPSDDIQAGVAVTWTELEFFAHRGLWHLMLGGVFERHPGLSFVLTEQFCGWIPDRLATLDAICEQAGKGGSVLRTFIGSGLDALSMKPSEYWRRNCYVGASFMLPSETAVRHELGVDRIMWGADYPHAEGTMPYTTQALRATFSEVAPAECRLMLGETAAGLYGMDLEVLQKAARRVGPKVADVHRPLQDDEWPAFPDETRCYAFDRSGVALNRPS